MGGHHVTRLGDCTRGEGFFAGKDAKKYANQNHKERKKRRKTKKAEQGVGASGIEVAAKAFQRL